MGHFLCLWDLSESVVFVLCGCGSVGVCYTGKLVWWGLLEVGSPEQAQLVQPGTQCRLGDPSGWGHLAPGLVCPAVAPLSLRDIPRLAFYRTNSHSNGSELGPVPAIATVGHAQRKGSA